MCTCQIRWIDDHGKATPDTEPAIGRARTVARSEIIGSRLVKFEPSAWYPICANHAERLREPGMHIWEFVKFAP